MAKTQLAFRNKIVSQFRNFDHVMDAVGGGVTFIDYTDEASSIETADIPLNGAGVNNSLYMGMRNTKFGHARIILSSPAAGGTRVWEYPTGPTTWVALSPIQVGNSSVSFFQSTLQHDIVFEAPSNWARITVNNRVGYFVRARTTAATNSPVASRIYNLSILDSTSERPLPGLNVGLPSPSDFWQTPQANTIEIGYGLNDAIDWNDGSARSTIIPPGKYLPTELRDTIQTLMQAVNAGITVSVSSSEGWSFSSPSGTFNLQSATGTNASRSVLPGLGFDGGGDYTGSGNVTHRAEYVRLSSGGQFIINTSRDNLIWTGTGARNINLPNGTYNASQLQTMLRYEMNNADGGLYDVRYFEDSGLWFVDRQGGTINISSCEFITTDVVGWTATSATSHLSATPHIHTEEYIYIMGDDQYAMNCTSIISHNLSNAGTYALQKYSAGSFAAVGAFTYNDRMMIQFPTGHTQSLWRITIQDKANPDLYVRIGVIAGFTTGNGYFSLTKNIAAHPTYSTRHYEDIAITSTGVTRSSLLSSQDVHGYRLHGIIKADKDSIREMEREVGTGKPFLMIPDPASANVGDEALWAKFAAPVEFTELNKQGTHLEALFEILEYI